MSYSIMLYHILLYYIMFGSIVFSSILLYHMMPNVLSYIVAFRISPYCIIILHYITSNHGGWMDGWVDYDAMDGLVDTCVAGCRDGKMDG